MNDKDDPKVTFANRSTTWWLDKLWAALTAPTVTRPDVQTPLDRFSKELSNIDVSVVDFRDLGKWPREHGPEWRDVRRLPSGQIADYGNRVYGPDNITYPREFGWNDKERAQPEDIVRTWRVVTTLMIHTAGVLVPAERFLGIPSQWGVSFEDDGLPKAVLQHYALAYLNHGNAANKFTVGLEVAGKYDWSHPAQRAIVFAFIRLFMRMRKTVCGPNAPCYIMPHRFSYGLGSARRNGRDNKAEDCGAVIWDAVWPYAQSLGYQLGPVLSRGKPLPFRPRRGQFADEEFRTYEMYMPTL